jgi:hypothetical protein
MSLATAVTSGVTVTSSFFTMTGHPHLYQACHQMSSPSMDSYGGIQFTMFKRMSQKITNGGKRAFST